VVACIHLRALRIRHIGFTTLEHDSDKHGGWRGRDHPQQPGLSGRRSGAEGAGATTTNGRSPSSRRSARWTLSASLLATWHTSTQETQHLEKRLTHRPTRQLFLRRSYPSRSGAAGPGSDNLRKFRCGIRSHPERRASGKCYPGECGQT
jgi:hypothetical protein